MVAPPHGITSHFLPLPPMLWGYLWFGTLVLSLPDLALLKLLMLTFNFDSLYRALQPANSPFAFLILTVDPPAVGC